jgi:ATP-dependent Lon protease
LKKKFKTELAAKDRRRVAKISRNNASNEQICFNIQQEAHNQLFAINEKFYKENEKLLEGGMWAEVTIAHNDVEEDNYAFYVEDLRPIQLARFNENIYFEPTINFFHELNEIFIILQKEESIHNNTKKVYLNKTKH